MLPSIAFLIVGTPRSGTTLVQRLACELPGVRIPPETHFFEQFVEDLLRRRTFPLDEAEVREELRIFLGRGNARGLDLDDDEVVRVLGGQCRQALDLFAALVRCLAGPAHLYGEKTPAHLRWWSPLSHALPELKLLWVVRDPRAVIASNLQVPWAEPDPAALAEEWNQDHEELRQASCCLPPHRLLILRYEDLVAGPAATRSRIAHFLGIAEQPHQIRVEQLFVPWETWKSRVAEPITKDRIDAWRQTLTHSQAKVIAAVCAGGMEELGYLRGREAALARVRRLALWPRHRRSRWKVQCRRRRERRRIRRMGRLLAGS